MSYTNAKNNKNSICFFHNRCAKLKLLYRTNKVFFILLMIFDELRVKFQIDLETFLSNKILNQHVCLTQFAMLNRYNKLFLYMKILPYLQEIICSIFILFRNKTCFQTCYTYKDEYYDDFNFSNPENVFQSWTQYSDEDNTLAFVR